MGVGLDHTGTALGTHDDVKCALQKQSEGYDLRRSPQER
jgi:hypothetical protein